MMGHAVLFEKDTPTFVPNAIYNQAIAVGAVPADGSEPNVLQDEVVNRPPTDPEIRAGKIMAVIKEMVARNQSDEFAASGLPHPKVVTKYVGFRTDTREIQAVWQKYHENQAEAEGA
jgi:hypothetical protein